MRIFPCLGRSDDGATRQPSPISVEPQTLAGLRPSTIAETTKTSMPLPDPQVLISSRLSSLGGTRTSTKAGVCEFAILEVDGGLLEAVRPHCAQPFVSDEFSPIGVLVIASGRAQPAQRLAIPQGRRSSSARKPARSRKMRV